MTVPLTKAFLASYLFFASREDGLRPENEGELVEKLRSGDLVTFEAILRRRIECLHQLTNGTKIGPFTGQFYNSEIDTVEGIIQALPSILAA